MYNLYRYEIERKLKKEKKERKKQKREEMMKQAANTPSSAASAAAATPTPNSTVNVYSSARENRSKERRQTIETKYDKKARAIEDLKALREKKKKSGRCITECSSYVELCKCFVQMSSSREFFPGGSSCVYFSIALMFPWPQIFQVTLL